MSELQIFIEDRLKKKPILLCSHAVMGFPSIDENHKAIDAFCKAGVDIIELQFPYSDPMADGPVLVRANQTAVASGIRVNDCFAASAEITKAHPGTAFLVMTYYNIVFTRGLKKFAQETAAAGIKGVIIPDLPIEEATTWQDQAKLHGLSPIFMVTPQTDASRLKQIAASASGFLYCVARRGITGAKTKFDDEFFDYVARVRLATNLPLGIGFGVQDSADVAKLSESGDIAIAIVCSKAIEIMTQSGIEAAAGFLQQLR